MTLSSYRKKLNKSQLDLANEINVSQSAVALYETGKRQPPISLIPKIAKVLDCSVEEIVYCFCDD